MPKRLTPAQIEQYERDGIFFPLAALDAAAVSQFRTALEEVRRRLGPDAGRGAFGQWHLCFRAAYDLATHPGILDAVEDVLGPDILVHSSTLFAKAPYSPEYVSWHQDGHYWRLDYPGVTSAWIALTDSTAENGCLRVIPGSQGHGRVPHTESPHPNNLLTSGLETVADESGALDVCLRAGELSLHHVDLIHGSHSNRSAGWRVGYAVRYANPAVRQVRAHHRVILARGRDKFGHFPLLTEPPSGSVDEALIAHREIQRWAKELLTGGASPAVG
jgi:ectoine hydroxylase-related dioxygenase (phytanoyl-CoA dioxygenase family)